MVEKSHFMGQDGFVWFVGVVEDRNDPSALGRVRVRCLGYHSSSVVDLPTTDKAKWKVVTVGGIGCDQICEDMLFNSRQVHMLMGKLTGLVERVFLPDVGAIDPQQIDALKVVHPFLTIMPTAPKLVAQIISGSSSDWDMQEPRYFVVTPDHRAILYYTKDHDGSGLLEDLKHLLKYSPDR